MWMNDRLLVAGRDYLNDSEVAITVVIRAIRRIFARDPIIRTCRRAILEHYEVVIPLATCGINTFLVIESEHRIRVTPVHWQCGISALVGPAKGDNYQKPLFTVRTGHPVENPKK